MVITDTEKQLTSITLIDDNPEPKKEEIHSCLHRFKIRCFEKYIIRIGIPAIIIIVMIILILLFREKNRRCGIFYNSHHCQQT